ncbi:MAG: hypothetical protein M0R76_10045 [Proteobacteria bacterium]|nr:hypothetical protein [Pseudomonadota bacterium]
MTKTLLSPKHSLLIVAILALVLGACTASRLRSNEDDTDTFDVHNSNDPNTPGNHHNDVNNPGNNDNNNPSNPENNDNNTPENNNNHNADTDTNKPTSSDTGNKKDSDPGIVACDNSGDCWDSCWGCAMDHMCSYDLQACDANADCKRMRECVERCPDNDNLWWDCYVSCGGDTNSHAEQLLQEFWDCIYCGACKNDCRNSGHKCDHLIDIPGTDTDTGTPVDPGNLTWRKANLTWFESYPDPGSPECIQYNGCHWSGYFAYFPTEQKSEAWVAANNIIAVHQKDFEAYKGKTLRLRQGANTIDARVYDLCSDSDCGGCCTRNANYNGHNFLIDVEIYTYNRMGAIHGEVEWACLDCN